MPREISIEMPFAMGAEDFAEVERVLLLALDGDALPGLQDLAIGER